MLNFVVIYDRRVDKCMYIEEILLDANELLASKWIFEVMHNHELAIRQCSLLDNIA